MFSSYRRWLDVLVSTNDTVLRIVNGLVSCTYTAGMARIGHVRISLAESQDYLPQLELPEICCVDSL